MLLPLIFDIAQSTYPYFRLFIFFQKKGLSQTQDIISSLKKCWVLYRNAYEIVELNIYCSNNYTVSMTRC